ncbi:putative hydrolase of the HAD superfamily [Murinocardiopsis flavida]|uniref:Putative hydrolase of the HAD superfamily n=1 Tax=Murinocardiopsis flavida TaxID=645275 RepID=A0A2P8DIX8_9ACTN|nr:HAD family phosphatase [Murinocardiopsis flavida]PSK97138.1 putative hydrolase of the HAD superfamily [Murinocardiopsis flavida]
MPQTCRAIITDWGGVLTSPLLDSIDAWLAADGIDPDVYRGVMSTWFRGGHGGNGYGTDNLIHALERGEIAPAEFESLLAAELRLLNGGPVPAEGMLGRMFATFLPVDAMYAHLGQARRQGVRTCLLSNSWGNGYPRDRFPAAFDSVVISGEVGMRKPEPEIFAHAVDQVRIPVEECVFIDDIEHNVRAAVDLGMVGILHRDAEETRARLEEVCGIRLDAISV